MVKRFEDLKVWQEARVFCKMIFKISQREKFYNDFALKNQIRRASGSIMDNIAEGFERDGNKEFIQFLSIAKGSAGECRSQLVRAYDCNYINKEELGEMGEQIIRISKMLSSLIKTLKQSEHRGRKYK